MLRLAILSGMNINKIFCYSVAKGMQGYCDSASKRLEELNVDILLQSQEPLLDTPWVLDLELNSMERIDFR